jgi:hypothetical protein
MAAQAQPQLEQIAVAPEPERWSLALRVAFRFCAVYFGLYCLTTQIVSSIIQFVNIPNLTALQPVRWMVTWTAEHVFHITKTLVYQCSGSGDKTFDWVLDFCVLVTALLATVVWSAVDRKRANYRTAYKWFHLAMRLALGTQMLVYGFAKVVPAQMPFPFLTRLLEPYGNFSPMGVLWASIGASPAYEIFAGSCEAIGGMLLFFPRTAFLGALICLADLTEVFTLNMTYDVPVKLFSFHLILICVLLLAPDWRRIMSFIFQRASAASESLELFASRRANRISVGAQAIFGLTMIFAHGYYSWQGWHTFGGGAPKPALYGIWNVDGDNSAWRRVVFERFPVMYLQHGDDPFVQYSIAVDAQKNTIAIVKPASVLNSLSYKREGNELSIDGMLTGQPLHLRLHLFDRNSFLLVNRGFHWIQEFPFNR